MQKKVFWVTFSIMVFVLIALASSIYFNKKPESPIVEPVCDPYKNMDLIVKDGNLNGCDCITDSAIKIKCQKDILNAILYSNALKQTDPSLCSEISDVSLSSDCVDLVKGNAAFQQKILNLVASTTNLQK